MASSSQTVPSDPRRTFLSKQLPSVRYLGTGLSGYVYETTWLGNRYTRKDFPLGSAKLNRVFEGETKSLLDLDHPNIVKCFGYTIGKSSCSLLLEYLDDGLQSTMEKRIEAQRKMNLVGSNSTSRSRLLDVDEIKRLISSKRKERETTDVVGSRMSENTIPFEVAEAVDTIFQIATGMEYLHDNGIVHGDLKTNNVLLNSTPEKTVVKVTDFGFSETKRRIKLVSKRTRHLEVLTWKAPELCEKLLGPLTKDSDDPFTESDTDSDEETDTSDNFKSSKLAMADVYSFGLTCLHVLGVELVYPNLTLTQLRKQKMSGFILESLPSACPEYLGFIIRSSLEPEPSRRPTFSKICELFKAGLQSKQLPHPTIGAIPVISSLSTGSMACASISSSREQEDTSCLERVPEHTIFLSHSGEQKSFVEQLCNDLEAVNHYPFFDRRVSLPVGEAFPSLIMDALRKCQVGVVVLSREYLSSKWPMLELVEFVRTRRSKNKSLILLPLFYKVSIDDLSDESIESKWRPGWEKMVGGNIQMDLEEWAAAVRELRRLNGFRFDEFGNSEWWYRDAIVREIFRLAPPYLFYETSTIYGRDRICAMLAGMFLPHTSTSAQVLGLYGMRGLGKTTMSKSLCNLFQQQFFGRVCYIEIKEEETVLERQKMVMRKLLRVNDLLLQSVHDVSEGWSLLQTRIQKDPVFFVIDNVQPDFTAFEEVRTYLRLKYNSGSKILVTSRDLEVVEYLLGDSRYCCRMPCLTEDEAARIFLQHGAPLLDYFSLTGDERRVVESFVEEAWYLHSGVEQFNPLVLKALGNYMHQSKPSDVLSWKTYLHEARGDLNIYLDKVIFNLIHHDTSLSGDTLSRFFLKSLQE